MSSAAACEDLERVDGEKLRQMATKWGEKVLEGSRNIAICMYSSVCGNATLSTHCFCFAQICIQTPYCCPSIAYPVSKSVVSTASAIHYIRRTLTPTYDVFSHTKCVNTNIATHRLATKCFSLQINGKLINILTQVREFRHSSLFLERNVRWIRYTDVMWTNKTGDVGVM